MRESILVTGGAGYVGVHVVVELAQAGYGVVVLDDYSNSTPAIRTRLEALAGRPVPCIDADVRDIAALRAAFHDHPIAGVVHCAGLKVVSESEERPLAYYDVNVGGTLALIEVMGEAGVAKLVYTSSAAVYGASASATATASAAVGEDAPLAPVSVYGRTVRVVEEFLRDLARANVNWRIVILRAFNAAGAHASGMLGAWPRGRPNDLVTVLARVAAGETSDASVYGEDWPTPDGTAMRDYVHVQDLAQMHVHALRNLATQQHPGTTLNAGSGSGHSVREVLAAFERACGRKIATRVMPRRAGDVATVIADTARAHAALAQSATRDLDAICADAWRWQRNGGRY
jgi:UDP-glucose 4-epimerase